MSLSQFLDRPDQPACSLVILNRTSPAPIQEMLEKMLEHQPIAVDEAELPDSSTDRVLLLREGEVVANSPLDELRDAILLVNSDLFTTGTRELDELTVPDVIKELDEVSFSVRGYPESHYEKLLLILISRYIERIAWRQQGGTIRTSFQYLARVADEVGTEQVYRRLDQAPVDVHLYGAPGWEPEPNSTITVHAGYKLDLLESWFVVYTPPEQSDEYAALLALEEGPNEWDGFWTYRSALVCELDDYIKEQF